ncbi:MFS transporter [Rhizosphaericola mali]|uniref:Uncharacterized MFS-type transporter E0W69_011545 n=1 Tax=Rhizosphaericola mali TaxID=2545455 RepID=A0A5P2G3G6_9BACT|nr:MFS transporter [Rhizosphaericola mali]QES89268.1 MFS transporter [Rhizosphaericola mali]
MSSISVQQKSNQIKLTIAGFVLLTFIGYFCIGLPLAVLPVYIHKDLGYSEIVAGVVISLQYATTFLTRGYAGNMVDKKGPKPAVIISMICFILSGILLYISFHTRSHAALSLTLLVITRLITGCAEGMVGASPINWAMLVVGKEHTATAISYNGIASYGALAVGAPLGVIINKHFTIGGIGFSIVIAALLGLIYGSRKKAVKGSFQKSENKSFGKVLKIVAPYGICLGLAGLGFGAISNFITLYFDYFHWNDAALCLTIFSTLFIVGRLIFGNSINKHGGLIVSLFCLAIETIGLFILWIAHIPNIALIGAGITGLGFSLVFPALGVVAVNKVSDSNKGAALAGYGLFIDISLGLTGPLSGSVIKFGGMHSLFSFSSVMVGIGLLLCFYLRKTETKNQL